LFVPPRFVFLSLFTSLAFLNCLFVFFVHRAAVKPALLRSPFFQRFDPVQLDSYVRHGFVRINPADSSDERVTLAFPRWAEGLVFGRGDAIKETWDRLEFGERVGKGCKEVRFVFPEEFGM